MIVITDKSIAALCKKVFLHHPNGEVAELLRPVEIKDGSFVISESHEKVLLKISGVSKDDLVKRSVSKAEYKAA